MEHNYEYGRQHNGYSHRGIPPECQACLAEKREQMGVLSWARPQRAIPVEEWKAISADSAPPGVYSPNMSDEDRLKWKAKKIGGQDPRVEIRKTVVGTPRKSKHGPWDNTSYAQVLLIVRPFPDDTVTMSMNGTAEFTGGEFTEMMVAVQEAKLALTTHNGPPPQVNRDRDAALESLRSTGQLDPDWSPVGMKPGRRSGTGGGQL